MQPLCCGHIGRDDQLGGRMGKLGSQLCQGGWIVIHHH
jgi:hypothetical protein